MTVSKTVDDLLEDGSGRIFIQSLSLFHVLKQVPAACIFHYHKEMFGTLEDLEEADHTRVPYLLQDVDFLKNFPLWVFISHVGFVDGLNRHVFPSQLVYPKCDLAKSTLSYELDELVVIKGSGRYFVVLLNVRLYVFNYFLSFHQDLLVESHAVIAAALAFPLWFRLRRWRPLSHRAACNRFGNSHIVFYEWSLTLLLYIICHRRHILLMWWLEIWDRWLLGWGLSSLLALRRYDLESWM